jgi:hypothetical protein
MSHISEVPERVRPSGTSGVSVHAAKLNTPRDKQNASVVKNCVSDEAIAPYPASPQVPFAAHAALSARRVWDRDDAYPSIVRVGAVRVIECKDAIQWIWQRRRKSGRWDDLGYFRNRDVLIERSGLDVAALRSLPPYHVGRRR